MDAGGNGASGAFTAMGDATSLYYDKLNTYDQQNEQKRQFDAQQADAARSAQMQQQQINMQRFDRISKNFDDLDSQFETMAPYLDDDSRAAFRNMIDSGRGGVTSFYASPTGDETAFNNFNAQYGQDANGKPKAWGTMADGTPITHDSIIAKYYEQKPIKDFRDKLVAKEGDATAGFIADVILNPQNHAPDAQNLVQSLTTGKITPAQAMASIVSTNAVEGFDSIRRGLITNGMNGATLAQAEDALKLTDPKAFKDANGVELPSYTFIQKAIESHATEIAEYRKAQQIKLASGTVQAYEGQAVTDAAKVYSFTRMQQTDGQADLKDSSAVEDEGMVSVAKSPAGKANYLRVTGGTEDDYNAWVQRTQDNYDIKKKVLGYNTQILGDQAAQSAITTGSAQITYDAIKPYIGDNAALQQMISGAQGKNTLTEAQFTSTILPQLLTMRNKVEMTGLFRTLAEQPGGIGRMALEGAFKSGLVDQTTYEDLNEYTKQMEGLRQKGINTQGMQLSAQYMDSALSKLTSQAMIAQGIPEVQAKGEYGKQVAGIASALTTQLTQEGMQKQAFQVGADGQSTQLAQWAKDRATAAYDQAVATGALPKASELGRTQAIASIQTAIAQGLQGQYTSASINGALPYAGQIGSATGKADLREQNVRLATANQTLTLMPTATEKLKSDLTTAISTNDYTKALNIIKTQNIDFDYAMQQAGNMSALASFDPNADLAARIKDPTLKAYYQSAVNLANQQRTLSNNLNTLKANKTSGGSNDAIHTQIGEYETDTGHTNSTINTIKNDGNLKAAISSLTDKYRATVAVDPITQLYKVVIPANLDPASAAEAKRAQGVIDSFNARIKPLEDRIANNNAQITALHNQRAAGGLNPDGTVIKTGSGYIPQNSRTGTTDGQSGVAYAPPAQVSGSYQSINSDEASQWAANNPQFTGVPSDCAAAISVYARSHGLPLPASVSSAGLEQGAVKAGWTTAPGKPMTGDLVVWTGAKFGLSKDGQGVGKHVAMVVGYDQSGNPLVLENPGMLQNGNQGLTQVVPMYSQGQAKFYRAPSALGDADQKTKLPNAPRSNAVPQTGQIPTGTPVKVSGGTPLPTGGASTPAAPLQAQNTPAPVQPQSQPQTPLSSAVTAMPEFKQLQSGVMSQATRQQGSYALAVKYLTQTNQLPGRVSADGKTLYTATGTVNLPAVYQQKIQNTATQIATLASQQAAQQANRPAAPLTTNAGLSAMPTLAKLPGNAAANTASTVKFVGTLKSMPDANARAQSVVAYITTLFKDVPNNQSPAVRAQMGQLYKEMFTYFYSTGGAGK